ncbi:TorD/DmsD family molecular chaperone [Vibrio algivorus]|uniref:TorD family cytoplasmic chaperone n=1 Tax=Vibrio algivorus TaxID=1667024 RepID=A0ABQ6ELK1_9VIBR|nr:molecular chaperone TorD family protein [Vibrio algivorus]GLT14003.1 TorD family cytoplasmic chaperone [Vibrio algivorus]
MSQSNENIAQQDFIGQQESDEQEHTQEEQITAEIYGLLACLFREAPSSEILQWLSELEVESCEQHAITNAWFKLKEAAMATTTQQVADEYQDLFIGIGCGEVVPFSSWHIAGTLMEKPLVAIRQDLKRLGFERQEDIREPEDSISALLEVMSMLQFEEFESQQQFFNAHICPWFISFCNEIEKAESAQFYLPVSRVLRHFGLIEQARYTEKSSHQIDITSLQ